MVTNDIAAAQTAPETLAPQPDSAPAATAPVPGPLRLDQAQSYVAAATDALDGWYARKTTMTHTYVADGHEAVRLIDDVIRELYRVRSALIGEIRADEDERFARVDRMLAACRARRTSVLPAGPNSGAARNRGAQ